MGGGGAWGSEAYARRAWSEARAQLADAAVDAEDLERLAVAAHLVGRDEESAQAWTRAHGEWVRRGEPDRAAMSWSFSIIVQFRALMKSDA